MSTRLIVAYILIGLMVAAGSFLLWHLTKGPRALGRGRRAHDRARRAARKPG